MFSCIYKRVGDYPYDPYCHDDENYVTAHKIIGCADIGYSTKIPSGYKIISITVDNPSEDFWDFWQNLGKPKVIIKNLNGVQIPPDAILQNSVADIKNAGLSVMSDSVLYSPILEPPKRVKKFRIYLAKPFYYPHPKIECKKLILVTSEEINKKILTNLSNKFSDTRYLSISFSLYKSIKNFWRCPINKLEIIVSEDCEIRIDNTWSVLERFSIVRDQNLTHGFPIKVKISDAGCNSWIKDVKIHGGIQVTPSLKNFVLRVKDRNWVPPLKSAYAI